MTSSPSLRDMLKNDHGVRQRKKRRENEHSIQFANVFFTLLFCFFSFFLLRRMLAFCSEATQAFRWRYSEREREKNKWLYVHYGHNPRSHAAHRDVMLSTISMRDRSLVFISRNTFRFPVNTMDNNMNISNHYDPSISSFSSDSSMFVRPNQVEEHQIDEQNNLEALKIDSHPLNVNKKREKKTVSFPFGQWWVTDARSVLSSMDPGNLTLLNCLSLSL